MSANNIVSRPDHLSFDEYLAEFGYKPVDDERDRPDDPDIVGKELATETIRIIRQGLMTTTVNCTKNK